VKSRSRARGWVLQILYARESRDPATPLADVLAEFIAHRRIRPESLEYMRRLIATLDASAAAIDTAVEGALDNWTLRRLAAIDRNVLRIGTAEILYHADVPRLAAIQEAIHLAEKYGTEESPRFVNGVLDAVMRADGGPGGGR
jgi:N utilization substance protein B